MYSHQLLRYFSLDKGPVTDQLPHRHCQFYKIYPEKSNRNPILFWHLEYPIIIIIIIWLQYNAEKIMYNLSNFLFYFHLCKSSSWKHLKFKERYQQNVKTLTLWCLCCELQRYMPKLACLPASLGTSKSKLLCWQCKDQHSESPVGAASCTANWAP